MKKSVCVVVTDAVINFEELVPGSVTFHYELENARDIDIWKALGDKMAHRFWRYFIGIISQKEWDTKKDIRF